MAILHAGARRLLKPAINFDSDGNEVKVEADTEIIIINAGLPILASKFRNNDRQYGLLDRRFVVTYEGPTTTRSGRKAKDFDVQVGRAFHRVTYAEMAPKQEPPF